MNSNGSICEEGEKAFIMSSLPKTWLLDLDGTILKHNGYKSIEGDQFIEGAELFLKSIPKTDMIVFVTSRKNEFKDITEKFLRENDIRFDFVIYGAPYGERILINDRKPSGLKMAYAVNTKRDEFNLPNIKIDNTI